MSLYDRQCNHRELSWLRFLHKTSNIKADSKYVTFKPLRWRVTFILTAILKVVLEIESVNVTDWLDYLTSRVRALHSKNRFSNTVGNSAFPHMVLLRQLHFSTSKEKVDTNYLMNFKCFFLNFFLMISNFCKLLLLIMLNKKIQ